MPSMSRRLLQPAKITQNYAQPDDQVVDAGAFSRLELQGRVLKTQAAGTVYLEHSATMEPDSWVALTGATWNLNGTTGPYISITGFLRFVRVRGDGSADGTAVVVIDLIAKA